MTDISVNRWLINTRKLLDMGRVSTARSLALMAFAALIGLILAGYALFTAHSTTTFFVPGEDVALVNQQPITRADYYTQIQTDYGVDFPNASREQREKVLSDMMREELFVQRGKELDVAETDPDVRTAMVNAVEQMAAADVMTAQPDQSRLLAYYNAHTDRYAEEGIMTVQDLVFTKALDANQAIAAIRAGSPMDATLARFNGRDSGKVNGEDFYFAAKIHLGDKLFELARSLSTGGIGGPISLADGFHILVMARNTPPKPRDFRTVQPQVLDDYRNEEIKRIMVQYNAFLKKRANVLIAGDMQ